MVRFRMILVFAVLIFIASGCLFGGSKSTSCSGTKLNNDDLSKVEVGKTKKSEVISLFGAPGSRWQSPDNTTEKLTYSYTKTTQSRSSLIFVWSVNDTKIETSKVVFVLKNGVVESFRKE